MKTKGNKLQTRINRRDTLPAQQAFPIELLRESRSESKIMEERGGLSSQTFSANRTRAETLAM